MATNPVIKILRSPTTGNTPSTLTYGQLAANVVDKKLWVGDSSNAPQLLTSGTDTDFASTAVSSTTSLSPTASHYVVLVTTGSTVGLVVNLPAASVSANQCIIVKKVDSTATTGSVAVTAAGSDTIDGANVLLIGPTQYDVVMLFCDGTSWWRINY